MAFFGWIRPEGVELFFDFGQFFFRDGQETEIEALAIRELQQEPAGGDEFVGMLEAQIAEERFRIVTLAFLLTHMDVVFRNRDLLAFDPFHSKEAK